MAVSSSNSANQTPPATRTKPIPHWFWAVAIVALGIPFLFRSGSEANDADLAARRQRIESMSASERERLERNLERFQQLTPDRQDELREIEHAVSEDEALAKTLLDYDRWLNTLSPWERLELRNATDREAKLQLVSAITTARKQEAQDSLQAKLEWEQFVKQNLTRFQGQERRPEPVRVKDNELSNMMTVLEDFAPEVKLTSNSLPGCAAYNIQLLAEVLKDRIRKIGIEQAREQPLSDETIQNMIDQISDGRAQSQVQELFDKWQSKWFVGYLAFKLEMSWWNESHEHPPSKEELAQVAKTMGGNFLEDFEKREKTDPRGAYFVLLMATRRATFQTDGKDLNDVLEQLELRRWRPSEGGGHGGERRGPRGDDDDRGRGGRYPPPPREPPPEPPRQQND